MFNKDERIIIERAFFDNNEIIEDLEDFSFLSLRLQILLIMIIKNGVELYFNTAQRTRNLSSDKYKIDYFNNYTKVHCNSVIEKCLEFINKTE